MGWIDQEAEARGGIYIVSPLPGLWGLGPDFPGLTPGAKLFRRCRGLVDSGMNAAAAGVS